MSSIRKAACGLGFIIMVPACANAQSMTFDLVAHVPQYCRISTANYVPIAFQDRTAEIGAVSEICNTSNGYDVHASFSNMAGGLLQVAGNDYRLDAYGSALRSNFAPAVQTLNWRLADAVIVRKDEPVIMRVTITPR